MVVNRGIDYGLIAALAFGAGALAGESLWSGHADEAVLPRPAAETSSATVPPANPQAGYSAEVLRVVDGDTFEARVAIWPGLEVTTKVRLRGIDAPEMRSPCHGGRERAEAARSALAALLGEGRVGLRSVGPDKYGGRVVAAAFTTSTPDLGKALIEAGHARRYDGGRRERWCLADGG